MTTTFCNIEKWGIEEGGRDCIGGGGWGACNTCKVYINETKNKTQ